jgi:hypothetical protein
MRQVRGKTKPLPKLAPGRTPVVPARLSWDAGIAGAMVPYAPLVHPLCIWTCNDNAPAAAAPGQPLTRLMGNDTPALRGYQDGRETLHPTAEKQSRMLSGLRHSLGLA